MRRLIEEEKIHIYFGIALSVFFIGNTMRGIHQGYRESYKYLRL